MRTNEDYRINIREIGINPRMASRIIRIGLPTGIQNMVIGSIHQYEQRAAEEYSRRRQHDAEYQHYRHGRMHRLMDVLAALRSHILRDDHTGADGCALTECNKQIYKRAA